LRTGGERKKREMPCSKLFSRYSYIFKEGKGERKEGGGRKKKENKSNEASSILHPQGRERKKKKKEDNEIDKETEGMRTVLPLLPLTSAAEKEKEGRKGEKKR